MNDEFWIAVAFLSNIGEQVIGKTDDGKEQDEEARNLEKIFSHSDLSGNLIIKISQMLLSAMLNYYPVKDIEHPVSC